MGSFMLNNQAYNIKAEAELAVILSYFDTNYIYGVMDDKLNQIMMQFNSIPLPNLVNSFEDNFKAMLVKYPENKEDIIQVRETTYNEIIEKIAQRFDFEFKPLDDMDIYGVAHVLYDFFVANYHRYVVKFFTNFIANEYESLYAALGLEQYKKDKDVSTVSNKKLFNNQHLAVVCSHMHSVLNYITEMTFDMDTVLNVIYDNNFLYTQIFNQHVFFKNDFFRSFYCTLIYNSNIVSDIVAAVKWEVLRRFSTSELSMNF